MFSSQAMAQFGYVLSYSMIWRDDKGRRYFTWSGILCLIITKPLPGFYLRLRR